MPNAGDHSGAGSFQPQGSDPAVPVNTGAISSPTDTPSCLADRFEAIMAEMAEGIIITDMEGQVQWVNKAALRLLKVSGTQVVRGISFGQLFYACETYDLSYRSVVPGINQKDMPGLLHATPFRQTMLCCFPSGSTICLDAVYTLLKDQQDQQSVGVICHLHDLTDFYLTHVNASQSNAALLSLINAIAHLRDLLTAPLPGEVLALPPSVHLIGQHLADLIRNLLGGQSTFLYSLGAHDRLIYYIALSGLTPEQAALRWENSGRYGIESLLDQELIAQLYAHKQVLVDREHMRLPFLPSIDPSAENFCYSAENFCWTPLFVKQELAGMFVVGRDRPYTAEESELVQAVAALATMMIEYVGPFASGNQAKGVQLVSQATDQIIDSFLTLASHELKTPLTTIKGNIQLALRRLAKLRDQAGTPCEAVYPSIEQVLESLEAANASARTQERIIRNLIDDTQIQTNTLELHLQHCALAALVRETVAQYQKHYPERQITLLLPSQELWVTVDSRRIQQVVQAYLINAYYQSPANHPIIVRLRSEGGQAYLSIHDEGPGIALEEQEHIWERLYRARDASPQSTLDVSMGMDFYLCRILIERHHGGVGVESIPGRGTIFWFSLPLVQDDSEGK
ncbi:PAS domain-containing sensor histidine kinase [Ktedonobacteria bacterium brp13]|nr:PAS domain-containing sensor histidine kinase [Ktedonobacteria bacterium brp13]